MDRFFPSSRRTGSKGSDRHFKSNRASVAEDRQGVSNREIQDILTRSQSVAELAATMNRGDRSRHYKLNLENLVSGRQPTIEFRQHVAVTSYRDISAWICFCSNFVFNSARLRPPSPFASSTTLDERSDALFDYVIKDEELRTFTSCVLSKRQLLQMSAKRRMRRSLHEEICYSQVILVMY